jgi:hypothetical protein
MSHKNTFLGAAVGALAAVLSILVMLSASNGVAEGVALQPYGVGGDTLIANITAYPNNTLMFFAGDTLFPLSYLLVFIGMYAATVKNNKVFALIGIGAGILTTLFDLSENSFFITYTLMIRNGAAITNPDVVPLYIFTTLKWMMAFATFYTFGLAFPRGKWFEWVIVILILSFPLFGALSTANPDLIPLRGLFLLVTISVVGLYFVYRYRLEPEGA